VTLNYRLEVWSKAPKSIITCIDLDCIKQYLCFGGGELYALPSAKTVVFKYRSFTVDFDCYAKIAGVQ